MFARGIHKPTLKPVYYYLDDTGKVVVDVGTELRLCYDPSEDCVQVVTPLYHLPKVASEPQVVTVDGQEVVVDPVSQVLDLISSILNETLWLEAGGGPR